MESTYPILLLSSFTIFVLNRPGGLQLRTCGKSFMLKRYDCGIVIYESIDCNRVVAAKSIVIEFLLQLFI